MLFNFTRDFVFYKKINNAERVNEFILKNINEKTEDPIQAWSICETRSSMEMGNGHNDFLEDESIINDILWDPMDEMLKETSDHGHHSPRHSLVENCWYNIYKDSDHQEIHNHSLTSYPDGYKSSYCAIYIAQMAGDNTTVFTKKQQLLHNLQYDRENFLTAKSEVSEGYVMLFPYYLDHYVLPSFGGTERISIAYNIISSF